MIVNTEKMTQKVASYIGLTTYGILEFHSKAKNVPISRLIAIALEHEMNKDRPFEFQTDLPDTEYVEYAFAEEAGKIMQYMKRLNGGTSLPLLVLCRADIGIEDKETFLLAFRECVEKKMVEQYVPKKVTSEKYYRVVESSPKERKKRVKRGKEYKDYLKLKKKFEKE